METSSEITKILPSFIEAVNEIKAIKKDAQNPFLKNKYASLDAIIETVKPILSKHGLCFIQTVTSIGVETIIMHTSGEFLKSGQLLIAHEPTKGLNTAQTTGVVITYAKRYQLGAMLGISTDEDTDGSTPETKKTTEQPKQPTATPKTTAPEKKKLNEAQIKEVETVMLGIFPITIGATNYASAGEYFRRIASFYDLSCEQIDQLNLVLDNILKK